MLQNDGSAERQFEAWLAEAKRLRSESAQAEVRFLEWLSKGEQDGVWHRMGYATFARLLDGENVCKPHRYEEFKDVTARLGIETVRRIGVDAAREANKIPDDAVSRRLGNVSALEATKKELLAFVDHNGTPPSRQSAQNIALKHYEPLCITRPVVRSSDAERIEALERDNARLRKENERLKKQIAKLTGKAASGPAARAS